MKAAILIGDLALIWSDDLLRDDCRERPMGRAQWLSQPVDPFLLREYPTVKLIYLTGEMMANARSMSRDPAVRIVDLRLELKGHFGFDPSRRRQLLGTPIPERLQCLLPGRLRAEALAERGETEARFRLLSSYLSGIAEQALADYPPRHLLQVQYEEMLSNPVAELSRIDQFLGFPDWHGWAVRAAPEVGTVRCRITGHSLRLSPDRRLS